MARFVAHEPCPNCGSRDNLGRYDDGSAHCFGGCGYYEKPTHAPKRDYINKETTDGKGTDGRGYQTMPEDISHDFPEEAVTWLAQYGIGIPEAIERDIYWSKSQRQLVFDMENIWQARNFDEGRARKRKYFTQGDVNDHLPIYGSVLGNTLAGGSSGGVLVLVEDCTSAIKIARQSDSMPLLGSHLSAQRLNRIARLYSSLIVWLDSDKLKESRGIADKARYMGLSARTVWTEADPKCYTDFMIRNYLGV